MIAATSTVNDAQEIGNYTHENLSVKTLQVSHGHLTQCPCVKLFHSHMTHLDIPSRFILFLKEIRSMKSHLTADNFSPFSLSCSFSSLLLKAIFTLLIIKSFILKMTEILMMAFLVLHHHVLVVFPSSL